GAGDLAFVDLLVVAGHGFGELVERAHQLTLVVADVALDLHHPVVHLLGDEGERLLLDGVLQTHQHLLGGPLKPRKRCDLRIMGGRRQSCQHKDFMTPKAAAMRRTLLRIYRRLLRARGPAGWWPGGDAFEVCVGAILVQNTAWTNVEKALAVLRGRGLLSFGPLRALAAAEMAPLIRSSGCFNVKARRLAALLAFLDAFGGRPEAMAHEVPAHLRARLLAVPGVGRET